MKYGKEQIKDKKENLVFDYAKTWYMIPYYSMTEYNPDKDFLGPLYEGKIISNERFFSEVEEEDFQPWFCLSDFITIFDNLSEPFVYPVKVENGARTEKVGENLWAAERIVLLKPLNVWEFFSMAENTFQGSINFDGQPYLPNGLRFPNTMKGNVKFDYNFLPSIISLPDSLDGTMFIRFCQIPPTWQFPKKINCLKIDSCTFYENLDFRKVEVSDLQFRNFIHPPYIPFPEIFTGKLSIEGARLSSLFIFPWQVGSLALSEVHLNAVKLPEKVDGDLTLYKVHFSEGISLPGSCKTFTAVESIFQEGFIMPKEHLEEIHMVLCTLPKKIILPDITFKKLTFSEMKIPSGLKMPKEFNGVLELDNCEFSKGFKLPDKITGTLKITSPNLKMRLKLPKAKFLYIRRQINVKLLLSFLTNQLKLSIMGFPNFVIGGPILINGQNIKLLNNKVGATAIANYSVSSMYGKPITAQWVGDLLQFTTDKGKAFRTNGSSLFSF